MLTTPRFPRNSTNRKGLYEGWIFRPRPTLRRLEVVALHRVAARDGRAVDAVLARELLDFVSAEAEWLEGEIPGFAAALAWPESMPVSSPGASAS